VKALREEEGHGTTAIGFVKHVGFKPGVKEKVMDEQ